MSVSPAGGGRGSERTLPFRRITCHSPPLFLSRESPPSLTVHHTPFFPSLIMNLPPSFPLSVHSHLLPVWLILLQKFPLITFLQTDLLLQCFIIACSFVLHLPFLGTDDNLNKKCNVQSSSWVLNLQFWGTTNNAHLLTKYVPALERHNASQRRDVLLPIFGMQRQSDHLLLLP